MEKSFIGVGEGESRERAKKKIEGKCGRGKTNSGVA